MGEFDPARQCTPTPQSVAGVTHELTIPPQERQERPLMVAKMVAKTVAKTTCTSAGDMSSVDDSESLWELLRCSPNLLQSAFF